MDRAELLRKRYGQRETIELSLTIVTPMFLGDASQKPKLRPEPFKGLLRYWWRVATTGCYKTPNGLLMAENTIFGGEGGSDEWGKSLVTLDIEGEPATDNQLPTVSKVRHPEVGNGGRDIDPLLYLGYGPVLWGKGRAVCSRDYLKPDEKFTLKLHVSKELINGPGDEVELLKRALFYLVAFGAIGSRSRNGWGSFQLKNFADVKKLISPQKITVLQFNKDIFRFDYPYSIAANTKNFLIWKTKEGYNSWQEAMKNIAEIYINLRINFKSDGSDDIDERHLLGFPITNHLALKAPNWGKTARHASPLRIFFRKKQDKYYGFILHLPFGISERMVENASGTTFFDHNKQYKIWEKVHKILDSNNEKLVRATINDCI